eukprot:5734664-Pyramimonas_sp.AAC.2
MSRCARSHVTLVLAEEAEEAEEAGSGSESNSEEEEEEEEVDRAEVKSNLEELDKRFVEQGDRRTELGQYICRLKSAQDDEGEKVLGAYP